MFSHIMLGANDIEASRKFYDATLAALGHASPVTTSSGGFWTLANAPGLWYNLATPGPRASQARVT